MLHTENPLLMAWYVKQRSLGLVAAGFLGRAYPRTDSPALMKGEFVTLSHLYVSYMIPWVGWHVCLEEAARRQAAAAAAEVFNMCHPQFIIRLNLSFLLIIWVYLMLGEPWPQMNQPEP